jgi:superfamily I DNA/RNA helicase
MSVKPAHPTEDFRLTAQQSDVVNYRPEGDLLVKGIPGSGKTLAIVARAAKLADMPILNAEPDVPLVRIFSFNRMLIEWIAFLASQLNEAPPEVTTFHSWAGQAIRALGNHDRLEFDDFAPALLDAMRKAKGLPAPFRAYHVLVDEGQDLTPAQLQLIKLSAVTSFTVAADKAQNIYKTGFTFKSIGINVQGRTRSLNTNLRGTRQIAQLASDLARHDAALEKEDIASDLSNLRDGPMPEVFHCDSFDAENRIVMETVRLTRSENRNATIAVLHGNRRAVYGINQQLGGRVLDKASPDMTSPGVIVSTIHNVKGLEFDTVIIKGVNDGILPRHAGPGESQAEEDEMGRRLLYVGMTRARRRLVLICGAHPSPYVRELDPRHYRSA